MTSRQPFSGSHRKLICSFDIGTTYSGISYSILNPGEVPQVKGVTRFPAQEHVGGDCKIPSVLFYDQKGELKSVGAEALQESVVERAEDEKWEKVEWFKLHLCPKELHTTSSERIPSLPKGKTVQQVFTDFIRYLYQCLRTYIEDTHANGPALWTSLQDQAEFVLSHPNGWEGAQQDSMRRAAVLAGLVPDTADGYARITFVTEGEASLHFCVNSGLSCEELKPGHGVMIVDAGGGTVDLSAYCIDEADGSFQEIAPVESRFQGSIFVSRRASAFLEEKLKGSKYGLPPSIKSMTECFDKTTKLTFRNVADFSYIRFGGINDKDVKYNIRSGQLKLLGSEVASLFEPSITSIVEAVAQQVKSASQPISSVFLVGGFAASDWIFNRLRELLQATGLSVCRPDSHVNKAVADGAVLFRLDRLVTARVAKFTYGAGCARLLDPSDQQHQKRIKSVLVQPSGEKCVPFGYDPLLMKSTPMAEGVELRSAFVKDASSTEDCSIIQGDIICYRGDNASPEWMDEEPGLFYRLCTVKADTSAIIPSLQQCKSPTGASYYRQTYDIVLILGLTELKAQFAWIEEGVEKRSPAVIIYEPGEDSDSQDDWMA